MARWACSPSRCSSGNGGRPIPLCLIPLWDVELAAVEVRRNAIRMLGLDLPTAAELRG